jgi:hypothetical protein
MTIKKDQIYNAITGQCINDLAANEATEAIWELLHPRAKKSEKIGKIPLSEIPINTNFRMIQFGKEFIKMSESTFKCFVSTGKRNRWLSVNHLVYPVK